MFENVELCSSCGGACCKRFPGVLLPEDVRGDMLEVLTEKFRNLEWAIDSWEGDPRFDWLEGGLSPDEFKSNVYWLRPAIVGIGRLFHYCWGNEGACVYLRKDGCALSPEDRPYGCRWLRPDTDLCKFESPGGEENSKREAALAWLSFQGVILKAANAVEERRE